MLEFDEAAVDHDERPLITMCFRAASLLEVCEEDALPLVESVLAGDGAGVSAWRCTLLGRSKCSMVRNDSGLGLSARPAADPQIGAGRGARHRRSGGSARTTGWNGCRRGRRCWNLMTRPLITMSGC